MYDYLIIGAGIIGSSIARELAYKTNASILVIEKETELGMHASGRNSGVIHSGFNLKPGSIKAEMCVEGSRKLRQYCNEHNVPMNECGTIVIGRNDKEEGVLEELLRRGIENGVPEVRLINRKELESREPYANGVSALYSPPGAVVDSGALLNAVVEDSKDKGAEYIMGVKVIDINGNEVITNNGVFEANHIINCAGQYADKIAHMMGVGLGYSIVPFRGEYYEVSKDIVNTMIYQPPNLEFPFLSIHLTKETDGKVLAGPSAVLSFGRESYEKEFNLRESVDMILSSNFLLLATHSDFLKMAYHNFRTSLTQGAFLREVQDIVLFVEKEDLKPARAGIRAQMVDNKGRLLEDMVVEFRDNSTHVLNTVSPGMTCSLAFAEYVVRNISD